MPWHRRALNGMRCTCSLSLSHHPKPTPPLTCPPQAGRAGEAPSTGLTEVLVGLGFETDRLKTGTPARVDARTVDFSGLEEQPGESPGTTHGLGGRGQGLRGGQHARCL